MPVVTPFNRELYYNKNKGGLTLVVDQGQVSSHDSHKHDYYLKHDGFKSIDKSMNH